MVNEKDNRMKCMEQSLYDPLPPVSTLLHKTEMTSAFAPLVTDRRSDQDIWRKFFAAPEGNKLTKKQKELRLKQSVKKLAKCVKIT